MNQQLIDRLQSSFTIKPYPSQLQLAIDIYTSLAQHRKVSIYESPTGTGKSYALIEGTLCYLQDEHNNAVLCRIQQTQQQSDGLPDWFNLSQPIIQPQLQPIIKPTNQNKTIKTTQIDDDIYNYSSGDDSPILRNEKSLQIYYTSRTHSQLKQWIAEVQRSKHKDTINLTTLGSRQQLCCNQQIISKSTYNNIVNVNKLNHICKKEKKTCIYYRNYLNWDSTSPNFKQNIYDIEDLYKEGQQCTTCPYYISKSLVNYSDVVCIPYQLLMDQLDKANQPIIVVDEAHNFGGALLATNSCEVTQKAITTVIAGLEEYRKKYHQRVKAKTLLYLSQIHKLFQAKQPSMIANTCGNYSLNTY